MRAVDRNYYEQRAEAELKAAEGSIQPEAVRAHYVLAGFYLDLVHGDAAGDRSVLSEQGAAMRRRARAERVDPAAYAFLSMLVAGPKDRGRRAVEQA